MTVHRKFASDTSVDARKSRLEIDTLLAAWKCTALQWTETFSPRSAQLRFRWLHGAATITARMEISVPADAVLVEEFRRARRFGARPTQAQLDAMREQRWRTLHRLLLLKLRADLNAVESGLGSAVDVFLPYLDGPRGETVAEVARPNIEAWLSGPATLQIEGPSVEVEG